MIQVTVQPVTGDNFSIKCEQDATGKALKMRIEEKMSVPARFQKLLTLEGNPLKEDDNVLSDIETKSGHECQMILDGDAVQICVDLIKQQELHSSESFIDDPDPPVDDYPWSFMLRGYKSKKLCRPEDFVSPLCDLLMLAPRCDNETVHVICLGVRKLYWIEFLGADDSSDDEDCDDGESDSGSDAGDDNSHPRCGRSEEELISAIDHSSSDPRFMNTFIQWLSDDDSEVREFAVWALGQFGQDPSIITLLIKFWHGELGVQCDRNEKALAFEAIEELTKKFRRQGIEPDFCFDEESNQFRRIA